MAPMTPLTVKMYDVSQRRVKILLLDMCTTSGCDCGTVTAIFSKIDSILDNYSIPWVNCVGFGVDNTSVNIGIHHSIMTLVKEKNSSCYFMVVPATLSTTWPVMLLKVFKRNLDLT